MKYIIKPEKLFGEWIPVLKIHTENIINKSCMLCHLLVL